MPDRAQAVAVHDRLTQPPIVRPAQLAAILRSEISDLVGEIITEIRNKIPEYARPMDGPYGHALKVGVQQGLTSFVDSIADPSAPQDQRDHVCRTLGQYEALEGRSLDSLQAAYRIGVHVGWRRVMEVGRRYCIPSSVMTWLADAMIAYMDELASLSLQGYLDAKARSGQSQQEWRHRLLRLILEHPPAPARAITELAELVGWTVPDEVTLIAIEPGRDSVPGLPDDALANLCCAQPKLLLPGRVDEARRPLITACLTGGRCAVGLAMPISEAWHSLRWARRALALSRAGVIGDGDVTFCEDHLMELWLLADEELIGQLAQRRLGALATLSPAQQQRLTETFGAWLQTRGNARAMADRMGLHPQTVRYRMRALQRTLDGQLSDPDSRFAIEAVLRAGQLRARAAQAAGADVQQALIGGYGGVGGSDDAPQMGASPA